MADPRLNGQHLKVARRDQYDAAVDEMLDCRGPETMAADPLARRPSLPDVSVSRPPPSPGDTYVLVRLADGTRHALRLGINAIGRAYENDLVLDPHHISRRHCVIVVHATGACEVFDTASRNGTRVNHRPVAHFDLFPGDVLELCDQLFLLEGAGTNGGQTPATPAPETSVTERSSATDAKTT